MSAPEQHPWLPSILSPALSILTVVLTAFSSLLIYIFRQEKGQNSYKIEKLEETVTDMSKDFRDELHTIRGEIRTGDAEESSKSERGRDELWCAIAELRKSQLDNSTVLARIDERTTTMSARLSTIAAAIGSNGHTT